MDYFIEKTISGDGNYHKSLKTILGDRIYDKSAHSLEKTAQLLFPLLIRGFLERNYRY